jgi:N-acetyl-alpha-D-glucosaminyl L-malate synthase BshA
MHATQPLRIGITCYASVGGSGILAATLGKSLAEHGHEVHFISYERPFRLPLDAPGIYFHPVMINDYQLFKYPDYTLPLSVKMAEVTRDYRLDVLHVHYAVPHATAAILAKSMLPPEQQPAIVTTLHGTDTTLIGRDPAYRPAIQHALAKSDAVTVVSNYLRGETQRLLGVQRPIDVIYNFFAPKSPAMNRQEVRQSLGIGDETLLLHSSNLRPVKRVDWLLDAVAKLPDRKRFKLLILAGESFDPYVDQVTRLGLLDRIIVRDKIKDVEEYLQAADIVLVSSKSESFCLSILEAMCFACPSVSTAVGGIPEVIQDGRTGCLVDPDDQDEFIQRIDDLISNPSRRNELGTAARVYAREHFSAQQVVPQYESLYRRVLACTDAVG